MKWIPSFPQGVSFCREPTHWPRPAAARRALSTLRPEALEGGFGYHESVCVYIYIYTCMLNIDMNVYIHK